MSKDFPDRNKWLAVRHTPANLHRTLGRVFFEGPGTYVRPRGAAEDARLAWYQRQCNGNAMRVMSRRVARRSVAV